MNNIAIIPARGGSKRIPRKNIRNFLGKPIIAYSIEIALESGLFNEVMVSTDDHEIAEIAVKFGAKVPFFRSDQNSTDFASTFDVLEEVFNNYFNSGNNIDHACCIYPCAPLIKKSKIKEAYELLIRNTFDSVVPVVKYSTPIQRAVKIVDKKVSMVDVGFRNSRSQDLSAYFYDAGQFYWLNARLAMKNKSIITSNTGALILSDLCVQDIDNENDWKLAEMKYKLVNQLFI